MLLGCRIQEFHWFAAAKTIFFALANGSNTEMRLMTTVTLKRGEIPGPRHVLTLRITGRVTEVHPTEIGIISNLDGRSARRGGKQAMSDRGFLFLFSALMVAAGGASAAYLVATGQAATVDGLFLALTALSLAAGFAMYLIYSIRRAMEPAKAAAPATKAAASSAAKPAAVQS